MNFKSKADPRWGIITGAAICISIILAFAVTSYLPRLFPALSLLVLISDFISIQVIIILVWAWFRTAYSLIDGFLLIRCGCFLWRVKIDEITAISKLLDSSIAPALSPDRLMIQTAQGSFYISPGNKEGFILQLLKINKNILVKD